MSVSIDLTTLSGWEALEDGTHEITIVAKADGYKDSNPSDVVIVTKGSAAKDFATDSWETIATAIKSGSDPYSLGDTKTDTVTIAGISYTATFKIVDDTVGRYATTSGVSHKVIEIQELFHNSSGAGSSNGFAWKASYSSGSGYPYSQSDLSMSTMDGTILKYLSSSLQAVLENTTVYSGPGSTTATSSNLVSATNKLFCASINEYYGSDASYGYANNTETKGYGQFTWYKNQGVTTSSYTALIKKRIEDSTAHYYWLRSPDYVDSFYTFACSVYSDGSQYDNILSYSDSRVVPCFAW